MPVFRKEEAKQGGWQQVREAVVKFEGDVTDTKIDNWGGTALGDDGKPLPPKEYFEVQCTNLKVLEVTEPLAMDVEGEDFSFRVNMSDYDGSFWIDDFVVSAENAGILLPDGLKGKRIVWKKATRTWDIRGVERSYSNFIIDSVMGQVGQAKSAPVVVSSAPAVQAEAQPAVVEPQVVETPPATDEDPMEIAIGIAVDKTETQFRTAVALHPSFVNSPFLPLAKSGAITQSLVNEGKLVLVTKGNKQVYAKA